jgi:predicted GIY-YIG superfamily endonuclease
VAGDDDMPSWFVYIVRCRDGSLYTGISNDVARRLAAHNRGTGARYTRSRGPVTLVHLERRRTRSSAQRREAAIKALARAEKLALLTDQSPAAINAVLRASM